MADKTGKTKKQSYGSIRARAGLPAKAGRRKLPNAKGGPHLTSAEDRARGKWLHSLGFTASFPQIVVVKE